MIYDSAVDTGLLSLGPLEQSKLRLVRAVPKLGGGSSAKKELDGEGREIVCFGLALIVAIIPGSNVASLHDQTAQLACCD